LIESQKNKSILITGATDGLGKALAIKLASDGAKLLLHGRNTQKGIDLVREIIEVTGNHDIHYYNANFASLSEVNRLSEEISKKHTHLDLLINNAAIGGGPLKAGTRELSVEGYELRFAVNYLSHFSLTMNLLPLLKQSTAGRIVMVSSIGQAAIDFNDLMMESSYDSYTAYCRSKLAQIIFGNRLAERVKDDNVIVNSVHPATLMPTNMVFDYFGKTAASIDDGVNSVLYVGCSTETAHITGSYFNQTKIAKANMQAYDTGAQIQLWKISEDLISVPQ